MPKLSNYIKAREMRGEKVGDFLSQDEVNALFRGVTGEDDEPDALVDEDDWAAAMAEHCDDADHLARRINPHQLYGHPSGWESINMPIEDWRKIVALIETQPLGEYYEIYTRIISNLPRK